MREKDRMAATGVAKAMSVKKECKEHKENQFLAIRTLSKTPDSTFFV